MENLLQQKNLNIKVYNDINLIAKYYAQINHYDNEQIYNILIKIMEEKYCNFAISKCQKTLLNIAKNANKNNLIVIQYIPITKNELEIIDRINSKPIKRIAFSMLCLAKYKNFINPLNNNWINYDFKDIFKTSNVSASIKEQCLIINEMINLGLITMNKLINNLSINVCFIDTNNSEEILQISDFRNLGNEYLLYSGEKFIRCTSCNILIRKRGATNKYCKECSIQIEKQKTNARVKKYRESKCNAS